MSGYQDAAQAPKFYYGNAMADLAEILPHEDPSDISEARRQASMLRESRHGEKPLNTSDYEIQRSRETVSSATESSLASIELKLSKVLRLRDEFSYVLSDIQRLLGK